MAQPCLRRDRGTVHSLRDPPTRGRRSGQSHRPISRQLDHAARRWLQFQFPIRIADQCPPDLPLLRTARRFRDRSRDGVGIGRRPVARKIPPVPPRNRRASSLNFDEPKNPRLEVHEPDFTVSALLIGGVKFPTGATGRLKEEFNEVVVAGAPESGIHGHDLTLGTGSYDAIIGGQFSLREKSFFFLADTQFTLRGDGAHQYNFANDLSWNGGPGYYLIRSRTTIVGLQLACSGEHKDVDQFRGQPAEDTGITSVFLGPRLLVSHGKLSAELAAEFPVSIDNTALQVVPDYRLRASV